MTVEVTTSRVVHVGDGDTGPFAIPFYFIENADIKALKVTIADGTEDSLVLDTDFTLDGAGEEAGGTLTLAEMLSSDYRLVIYRDPAALQETRYPRNDPFPAASHEMVADRLTMIVQRVLSLVTRGLRQPDGDSADIDALPAAATRASKYLAFDADGHPVATSGTGESAVISTFSETVLDDETAGDWLTTLGFSAFVQTLKDAVSASAFNTLLGMSTFFKTLLGAASDSALRTLLGLGTAAVEPTTTFWSTGDVKITLKIAADAGWVLMNDGTIGNAASGGTTRANADTEALFTLLWTNVADAQCAVSTGRGASAAADYAANKTIALPKSLGRALAVYGAGSGLTSRALALTTGTETHELTINEMPEHEHTETGSAAGGGNVGVVASASNDGGEATCEQETLATGGGAAHPNMQPTVFLNVMIKL